MTPKASVICCTYRRDAVLCDTLRGLIAQQDGTYEILVVDQLAAHDNQTNAFLHSTSSAGLIRYYDRPMAGLTAARNFGAQEARGEFLLYCDDDVKFGPNWVSAHIGSYDDRQVAAVAGQVLHEGEVPRDAPGTFAHTKPLVPFEQIYGANFSIRKDVYFQICGSDENLGVHAYTEDLCLARKLTAAGYILAYNPLATVLHLQFAKGGCRISDLMQPTQEWEKPFSKLYWMFLSPPRGHREFVRRLWETLRHGPFRRTAIVRPWRQPAAWAGYTRAVFRARRAARQLNLSTQIVTKRKA